ncbi:transcriptional regulator, LacI family [Actinacidiphila yanglinensis]|uniref:Transcriptional regulator, LacI family n=2 Tax=Actinacidiphila yanglinensis TaxID=310779 RepID=A0A1H5SWD7_9ACTN|nr:transcriptional regulator, LacI family [Actinacidiphila yanglinensis]
MADVARAAGVSVTTVSHVLNKTRPVLPDTVRAVQNAVAACGYVPEKVARLQNEGLGTIGLAMSAMSNPYFSDVVHGIDRHSVAAGYSLLLADTHDDEDTELRAVGELLRRRVSAVILAPSGDGERTLTYIRQAQVPVVVLDRFVEQDVDQIGVENVEATAQLVDHLVAIGHRRIAMVAGRAGLATSTERTEGYRLGLRRNGVAERPELVAAGDSHAQPAEAAVAALLRLPEPPTAIVVGNNRMTIGAMRQLRAEGLTVPDDIALVAFDDFEWSDLFHPRLTAIAQPTLAIGEQAFGLALSRIRAPATPPRRVLIRPDFMHRESCGCRPETHDAGAPASPAG